MPTIHLIIQGKVQGVFYRATAKKIAIQLSVTGWIRNKEYGEVEAMVTGDQMQLKKFVDWCRVGPTNAEVTELIETALEETVFNIFYYQVRVFPATHNFLKIFFKLCEVIINQAAVAQLVEH